MTRFEPYCLSVIEINRLRIEIEYLKLENERLNAKIDNFNKALKELREVK